MTLSAGAYLAGLAGLAAVVGFAALGAWRLRSRLLPGLSGVPAHLATAVIAIALVLAIAQALGSAGLFSAVPFVTTVAAAGLALGIALPRPEAERGLRAEWGPRGAGAEWARATGRMLASRPRLRRWAIAACFAVAAVVLVRFGAATALSYGTGMTGFDSTWYHGTLAASMAQSGSTFELHQMAPQFLSWFYPQSSELLHAMGMILFDRDLLSPGLNLVVLIGCMAACWSLGRPYGLAPATLAAGSVVLGSGLLSDQAGEARNDLLGAFFTLVAVALLLNTASGSARVSASGRVPADDRAADGGRAPDGGSAGSARAAGGPAIGALAVVGLAAGLAAGVKLNYLPIAAAIVAVAVWLTPAGRRLGATGALLAPALIGGGYWYLRNAVHSGNPLPWITSAGPVELPGPDQELGGREAHGVIEYLLDLEVWEEWFLPGLREGLTLLWPVVAAAAALTTVVLLRRGGVERAAGVVILAGVGAWLLTPASASGPEGEPRGFVSGLRYLAPVLVLAVAMLPVAVVARRPGGPGWQRSGDGSEGLEPRRMAIPGPVAAGILAAAVAALAAGGYLLQTSYLEERYAEPDFATPGLQAAFEWAQGRSDTEIATTATRQYPLFGADLSNQVEFVGVERPAGGFVRPQGCREWRQALNGIRPEYVLVAWDRIEPGRPQLPPEAGWTAASPRATAVVGGPGAVVFGLSGPLDPVGCPGR